VQIGFATRVSPKDNHNHVLLGTQMLKPKDLESQLNIKMGNCWAIVRYIVDLCYKLDKDNYLLMKDPNKELMYLYEVPSHAFDMQHHDDDDDQDETLPGS
jgi:translation initiation factor 3 subunit D